MAQHPSLRSGRRSKQHRSVLKRYERLQTLTTKEEWKEGDSVFGLPKVKTLRIKIKKEKAAETAATPETAAAGTAATPAAGAAKAPAKGAEKGSPKEAAASAPKKEAKKEKGK